MGSLIQRALGVLTWCYDELEAGRHVGSFKEGEPIKEILLPDGRPLAPVIPLRRL